MKEVPDHSAKKFHDVFMHSFGHQGLKCCSHNVSIKINKLSMFYINAAIKCESVHLSFNMKP